MKALLITLTVALLTLTSCEVDNNYNCECSVVRDTGEYISQTDINDCRRHGEYINYDQGYRLDCIKLY
jgi:hypothetical protein